MCSGQIRLCGPGTALTEAGERMGTKEVCATWLLPSKDNLKLLHWIKFPLIKNPFFLLAKLGRN